MAGFGKIHDFLGHVRGLSARSGPNSGKPLSPLRVNDIVTDVERFYAFVLLGRSRPGMRVVISWTSHALPSESWNGK